MRITIEDATGGDATGFPTESLVIGPDKLGLRLTRILRGEGLPLNTRCGEKDMCAGCTIELVRGSLVHVETGEVALPGEIRACQYMVGSDAEVVLRIPPRALLAYAPQVVADYRINVPYARDPLADSGLGVAVDVGTTTVVVQLVDLLTGDTVGRAAGFNKQMHFGDDVLTRINLCSTDVAMLAELQRAIVAETLRPLLDEALAGAERQRDEVSCITVAGNTTMLHLLVGEDPSPMGIAPFTPRFLDRGPFPAGAIGLEPGDANVHLLPSIAAYIGADLTAGLLASGLAYEEGPSLLVDVGTNGEILLMHGGEISGCATAAGPAFEGSRLTCGLRAGEGAISHLSLEADPFAVRYEVIGDGGGRPTGLCGSAYIDFLAEGRRVGLLDEIGRFSSALGCDSVGRPVASNDERLGQETGRINGIKETGRIKSGRCFKVAKGQGARAIVVSEADVASLLQAKAAIAAGILTLLARHKLDSADVKTLYLAGGFGMHLDIGNAIACGLLPGFSVEQVQLVGNASLAGATLALLDKNLLAEMKTLREKVEVVELNLDPSFEDRYISQLSLP